MGRIFMREKRNKEDVFDLIQKHPEGLDDDHISATTGITPRQQVQQLCNRLAASNRIRRKSRNSRRRALVGDPLRLNAAELPETGDENVRWRLRAYGVT